MVACVCNARAPAAHCQETKWWALGQWDADKKQGEWSPRNSTWGCSLASTYTHTSAQSRKRLCTHTNSKKTYIYFYITCFYSLPHFINLLALILKGKQKVLTWKVSGVRLLKNAVFFQRVRINREATAELQQQAPPTEETSEKLDPHVVVSLGLRGLLDVPHHSWRAEHYDAWETPLSDAPPAWHTPSWCSSASSTLGWSSLLVLSTSSAEPTNPAGLGHHPPWEQPSSSGDLQTLLSQPLRSCLARFVLGPGLTAAPSCALAHCCWLLPC